MRQHIGSILLLAVIASVVGLVAWQFSVREAGSGTRQDGGSVAAVAVEVAPVESGVIRDRRVLSGTLDASTRFLVAPKVGGLIKDVLVDLGDHVEREQVVARIDDPEFVQAVVQAQAELAVREAGREQAEAALELARSEYNRSLDLQRRQMASESELDERLAAFQSAKAALALAEAQVQQAAAALELARISLGYTEVRASWSGGPDVVSVGERLQDAGNTVQPNTPILSIVALDPLTAVVYITERDYVSLRLGQQATLYSDALPGRPFAAEVVRIAPVFRETSRQARVELRVPNPDELLKPGMFARVLVVLRERHADAIVPLAALTRRDGLDVVFALTPDGQHVRRVPVEIGIVEGERVEAFDIGAAAEGRVPEALRGAHVVTLGQQLLDDGSLVTVSEVTSQPARAGPPSLQGPASLPPPAPPAPAGGAPLEAEPLPPGSAP